MTNIIEKPLLTKAKLVGRAYASVQVVAVRYQDIGKCRYIFADVLAAGDVVPRSLSLQKFPSKVHGELVALAFAQEERDMRDAEQSHSAVA